MKVNRGRTGSVPLVLKLGCSYGWVVKFTSWPHCCWERAPVTSEWEAGKVQKWSGCFGEKKNLLLLPRFEPRIVQHVAISLYWLRILKQVSYFMMRIVIIVIIIRIINWDHFKVIQKIREQHTWKTWSQGTTENSHIGHCTHTSESTNVKVQ